MNNDQIYSLNSLEVRISHGEYLFRGVTGRNAFVAKLFARWARFIGAGGVSIPLVGVKEVTISTDPVVGHTFN